MADVMADVIQLQRKKFILFELKTRYDHEEEAMALHHRKPYNDEQPFRGTVSLRYHSRSQSGGQRMG
jgi:hypothetical protein